MSSVPGQRSGYAVVPRNVLLSVNGVIYGSGVIDAARAYDGGQVGLEDELRAGTMMARITSTGLWTPCKRTTVTPAGAGTSTTSVPVVSARSFRTGDVISVGASTGLQVTAVNYTSNTITVNTAITFANSAVVVAQDGSQTCRGILGEFVKLRDPDGVVRNKVFSQLVIAGLVDQSQIVGDLAAVRSDTAAQLTQIQFGDTFGQS